MKKYASLLSADASNYAEVIRNLENKNIDGFHFDIMDGHFVKNFAFNATTIKTLRKVTTLPFQAHLEIDCPGEYIDMFIDSGCSIITIHPQTCIPTKELRYIKAKGATSSVAIDPDIDVNIISDYLGLIDNIIILTVYPGFGEQKFIEESLNKITAIKKIIKDKNLDITVSVDGGVSNKTEGKIIKSGADILIYGSSMFKE